MVSFWSLGNNHTNNGCIYTALGNFFGKWDDLRLDRNESRWAPPATRGCMGKGTRHGQVDKYIEGNGELGLHM
jgi:hypothetical protein